MPELFLSKEITVEAAHYLYRPDWSAEKNLEVFQKCCGLRENGSPEELFPHGHSYRIRITVAGPVHPETGFVLDFRKLKKILKEHLHARLDHRFLNKEVEPFRSNPYFQTTAENLCLLTVEWLKEPLTNEDVQLAQVEIWETKDSKAVWLNPRYFLQPFSHA